MYEMQLIVLVNERDEKSETIFGALSPFRNIKQPIETYSSA